MDGFWRERFELNRGGEHQNVRVMEGMRGLAVFLVFLVHYSAMMGPWISGSGIAGFAERVQRLGNIGVDVFFVLSGYLIYGSLIARAQPFWPYMRRRVMRIYPAFLAVFVLYLALSLLLPQHSKLPQGALATALYLLQNLLLLPGILLVEPLITVAWSLSYELFYYLALPLVIALVNLRSRSASFRLVFFVGLSACLLLGYALFLEWNRLTLFLVGIIVFELVRSGRVHIRQDWVVLAALGVMLATTQFHSGSWPRGFALLVALFVSLGLFCLALFTHPQGRPGQLLCWTPLRWLGNMSYSYYLLHGLAMKAIFIVLSHVPQVAAVPGSVLFWVGLPIVFALTLPPCIALFLAVERPLSLAPARPRASRAAPLSVS